MKRILVTGGAGFVGSHCIAPLLARGYEVHAVGRREAGPTGATWHQADLLDEGQCARVLDLVRPSHLLHLAWIVTPGEYWTSPLNWTWIDASARILEYFAKQGGQRAVFVGSGAEYDPHHERCVESVTPLAPTTLYGACKASLSILLPVLAARYGLESVAWGRLFYVYGPRERAVRLVPSAICSLLRGQSLTCTSPAQVRDALFIEDAAAALTALLDSHVTGAVNVGTGHGVSLRSLLLTVGAILGRETLLKFEPSSPSPGDIAVQVADTTRLTQEVGWRAHFTQDQGLARTVNWWREQVANDG
jgi:nucleoside-diphosphate-sugar epimerase